jgi:maleate isomerase
VVTSAGALVDSLRTLGARTITMIAPYMKSLACLVADYIQAEGVRVVDSIALEVPDNLEVGRRDPMALVDIYKRLNLEGVDVLVLSSCVQMPSLAAVPLVEKESGLPVVSASICTTYQMLRRLGLSTYVPEAGTLLSGRY